MVSCQFYVWHNSHKWCLRHGAVSGKGRGVRYTALARHDAGNYRGAVNAWLPIMVPAALARHGAGNPHGNIPAALARHGAGNPHGNINASGVS